jgi:hypothetical protein
MKLLTKSLREKLIANHNENQQRLEIPRDFQPVVKFFNPTGSGTWLITELDPETNLMFGLCDLGMGYPEIGYVSFDELREVRCAFGLGIERDMHWKASKTLSAYADEAREYGGIKA